MNTVDLSVQKQTLDDITAIRQQFPALTQKVYDRPLIYFDNGATSQKPQVVIDALTTYYRSQNANVHRGVHFLSQQATESYEEARKTVQHFIGASHEREIIFTKGTTDGINLVASSLGESIRAHDHVLISYMEHHSNIVPWQMLCERKNATLKVIPILDNGELDMDAFRALLCDRTKIVAITHVSNTLGTINPIKDIIQEAHQYGAKVLIDGAQSIQHLSINVNDLDCDFYTFSGHKVFGPTGIGVLYGKERYLEEMPPYQGGGDMIAQVSFERTTYNELPLKFEAGTPNIAGVLALKVALEYLEKFDIVAIHNYEHELLDRIQKELVNIDGVKIIGQATNKASVVSFVVQGIHPYDIGTLLDKQGIAVRTGHHCTQPIMERFKVPGTVRASLAFYNTQQEIEQFIEALKKSIRILC